MRHGSLFSGIGGFDLAAEWMGWENVFHCEWNEFGQKVLKHYWPNAISYHDITKTDFTIHRGNIDIITGGFPCQPYSMAGKRKGKDDERHLWPEMLRAIKEIQPRWVVGENVYGLVNWSGGLVFHEVQTDLEAQGYEVQPYVLPACAVNAPHRRDRVWFVAYRKHNRLQHTIKRGTKGKIFGEEAHGGENGTPFIFQPTSADGIRRNAPNPNTTRCKNWDKQHWGQQTQNGEGKCCTCGHCVGIDQSNAPHPNGNGFNGGDCQYEVNASEGGEYALGNSESLHIEQPTTKHTNGIGQEWRLHENKSKTAIRKQFSKRNARSIESKNWHNFPTQSPICGRNDGISYKLDGITFSKWRNESIKAYGNAIVPQVALQIFKTIEQHATLQLRKIQGR